MKLCPEIGESIELRFSRLAQAKNARGDKLISFGLGEPDFPTPPEVIEAASKAMRDGMTRYSNPFGLMELRRRIARKLVEENGIAATPEQILVAPGAKMALSLVLAALVQPGDEVVVVTPCYASYIPQVKIAEPDAVIRLVPVRLDDFTLDVDALAAAITPKTRVVLINSPQNPSGHMLSEAEIDALERLLAGTEAWLISDEIYEKLAFSGTPHRSPAARPALAARTVTINGFSKAFAMTGWRIGYLHLPNADMMERVSRLQQHLNTNTAPFIQMAALTALDLPAAHLDIYNRRLAANAKVLAEGVAASNRLNLVPSQGGLFSFLDVRGSGLGSDGFASGLVEEESVAATPGVVFGAAFDGWLRISMAIAEPVFAEGVARLVAFAERQTP